MNTNKELVEQLTDSALFREYEQAFSSATGMPLALRPLETFDLPFQGKNKENGFCKMMAKKSRVCGACLQMQEEVRQHAMDKPATAICVYGLSEAAVPMRLGDKVIGFLQTGQVLTEKPSAAKVDKVVASAQASGIQETSKAIKEAYLQTAVVPREKLGSLLRLLTIFAE